jgi:hypothetical protein
VDGNYLPIRLKIYCYTETYNNMPEYFDISLITRKTEKAKEHLYTCLFEKFGLARGKNKFEYFGSKEILVFDIDDDNENDFTEICIGLPDYIFHKDIFDNELRIFTSFINTCFECCNELEFALCSYELNGYLLGTTKKLNEFDDKLLNKFPLSYKRQEGIAKPLVVVNLRAQDIFPFLDESDKSLPK